MVLHWAVDIYCMSYAITQPYPYTVGNVSVTGTSGSSSIFTVGANGTSATDMWTNTSWTTGNPVTITKKATIDLQGDDADVVINGVSLTKTLVGIQERLGILETNPALEAEFDELKAAADHYRELEKKFKEQKKVWDTLKKQDL